jgi:hypothetical protein
MTGLFEARVAQAGIIGKLGYLTFGLKSTMARCAPEPSPLLLPRVTDDGEEADGELAQVVRPVGDVGVEEQGSLRKMPMPDDWRGAVR